MNTEHTPGPWRVDYAQGIIAANGIAVAYVEADHSDTPSPDARLIAAAPDLLAALEATLVGLKEFQRIFGICVSHGERMGGWLEEVEEIITKIEPAIAKAEGKA